MIKQISALKESVVFSGRIGEVVHMEQVDGRIFEKFRRPPGTRLIIISPDNKILITKEYRQETDSLDMRLPGGKVRDSLDEYNQLISSGKDIIEAAAEAAKKEALEETGLILNKIDLLTVASAGATVEWDLYYFICHDYSEDIAGQHLEQGEDIEITWASPEDIINAIKNGNMREWRSVGVLLGLVLPEMKTNQ